MRKPHGIIVFGANGSGKSTLGRELARALNYKYMDIEDYHFEKSEIPYTIERSHEECLNLMLADIEKHGSFVLSAVTGDFGDIIPSFYELAVFMSAPFEVRMKRIEQRAHKQHGGRIRQGGDMYKQHLKFIDFAASRDLTRIEQWTETLSCPVIHIDGMVDVSNNVNTIIKQLPPMLPDDLGEMLKDYRCAKNHVGCSSSGVYRYQNSDNSYFLKIDNSNELVHEHDALVWLNGKLPVPEVKYFKENDSIIVTELGNHHHRCEDIFCVTRRTTQSGWRLSRRTTTQCRK